MADKASGSQDRTQIDKNSDKVVVKPTKKVPAKKSAEVESDTVISILGAIQSEMRKQTTKLVEQDKQLRDQASQFHEFKTRLDTIENTNYDYYEFDPNADEEFEQSMDTCEVLDENTSQKRTCEIDDNNSRFKSMAKKFKSVEQCDRSIDDTLALNITELFRNGIDEERFEELIKSDSTARPENCEGLVVVKLNQLIWDAVSTQARGTDKKLQNIETSVVKAASVLSKVVDQLAKFEADMDNSPFGKMLDKCDDVLALMGHANRQLNLARKDFLRPELNKEYSHLCSYHRPYTSQLFGDDVSKSARELEDCSKISSKMFQSRPAVRGQVRRRPMRASRFRGGYPRGTRGRGSGEYNNSDPKNFQRRGGSRPLFKN